MIDKGSQENCFAAVPKSDDRYITPILVRNSEWLSFSRVVLSFLLFSSEHNFTHVSYLMKLYFINFLISKFTLVALKSGSLLNGFRR